MINIIDIAIILIIIMGAVIGFKRGVIKQGVMTIGMVLVLILSFALKNPISALMYKYFPFFNFDLIFKNATVLNIIVYEVIAFLIAFSILEVILIILVKISSIVETLLKVTVILAIPSKILGAILGAIEYYLLTFVILYIMSLPIFKINNENFMTESKLKPEILSNTIIVSNITNKNLETFNEVSKLIENKENLSNEEFNCKSLKIMIEKDFLKQKSAKYLYEKGKINTKCGIGE